MNKSIREAEEFCHEFLPLIENLQKVDMAICPPFTSLDRVGKALQESRVRLGGQNVFAEEKGAYTGEISPFMLKDAGCQYVIIGHSERRQILDETDEVINRKLHKALEAGLIPILCVGETLAERENNQAEKVVQEQLTISLSNIKIKTQQLVIAYEPVWAIGTGITASADDAQVMCSFIRGLIEKLFDYETAITIPILYGGSVNDTNLKEFLQAQDVDGALVGGASLEAKSFAQLVRIGDNG